jgi:NAD(P)-dependent dehydrogenase (short-subunit alcohol dehydrogenase family)
VLAPVLLTELLAPVLVDGARMLFVTSGGMYGQRLVEDDLEYERGDYSPTTAYARSKRVQVELLPLLKQRWPSLCVYATHPGWADTPGVQTSLPRFRAVMRPVLRDADGGAETTVWLAATQPAPVGGTLWHDRRQRPFHLLPTTRPREGSVDATWAWVRAHAGLG